MLKPSPQGVKAPSPDIDHDPQHILTPATHPSTSKVIQFPHQLRLKPSPAATTELTRLKPSHSNMRPLPLPTATMTDITADIPTAQKLIRPTALVFANPSWERS